jgi:hypothetical protein
MGDVFHMGDVIKMGVMGAKRGSNRTEPLDLCFKDAFISFGLLLKCFQFTRFASAFAQMHQVYV